MTLPKNIKKIISELEDKDFEAFIVGGCVRDILLGKEPSDWDITTNAKPEDILKIFPDGKYENDFGTVILPIKNKKGETEEVYEITTYRSEKGYSDRRRPDQVLFEKDLDKDLSRRDFTVNALAMRPKKSKLPLNEDLLSHVHEKDDQVIVDLFGGMKDLKKKIIRAVGEPVDRFREDALRMMRAIRLSAQLDFSLEPKTQRAISKMAGSIKFIAKERIAIELVKILSSDKSYEGIMDLHKAKLLQYILPELEHGVGVGQNYHHINDVFEHNVLSLKYCSSKDWRVRLAALLHDVGKVKTKKIIKGQPTFYNHEYASANIARRVCKRLRFSSKDSEKIITLIRGHMFYYNVDEVTAASVRRLIKKVGEENLEDLIALRIGDRLGSGVKKAMPYKLRHLKYMFERVRKDPVSVKCLKINGDDLIKKLKIEPSPKIGEILDVLLSEVIEDPKKNEKKYLEKRARELNEMDSADLRKKAKEVIEEERQRENSALKREFRV
ncbi:HD domain-containing protein [Candidatus Falkowbacteria bacterium]|nr:HD domain-containing protein [Candidatus Falkowbacteria bacterium]